MAVTKKNIFLENITETMQYHSSPHPITRKYPERNNYAAHARKLESEYDALINKSYQERQRTEIKRKGTYAEFSGAKDYELATKSLENKQAGVQLLNIKTVDGVEKATVYIPDQKEDFYRMRINDYATKKTKKGHPRNKDLIGSIESIKFAMIDSLWTDKPERLPVTTPAKCEVWLRYEMKESNHESWKSVETKFHDICDALGIIVYKDKHIIFPERIVKLVSARKKDLAELLASCEYIAEMRRAEEPASFFTDQGKSDQKEWNDDLLSRCIFSDSGTSICLLDAGVNDQHRLIQPALLEKGLHACDSSWGVKDSPQCQGHGTEMAGIAIYNDLQEDFQSMGSIEINHKLESVKILPNTGGNIADLYGAITQQAVSLAEIDNPSENRVICMAVTADDQQVNDGRPSSWSASLDELCSASNEETKHRLFIVSAGNTYPDSYESGSYPDVLYYESVQDPGQAWNAITVGGYTDKIEISDECFSHFYPLAPKGGISPYSTTSVSWGKTWPVKPEVLFKAGNIATNGSDYDSCDDLSLLTTGFRPFANMYSTIHGTSAATAQAANFAARLMVEYPQMWPETIRALMVHSAEWTDEMIKQFCPQGENAKKTEKRNLLRTCGYGIPNLETAIQCSNNDVNMIVQGEIQPFRKENGRIIMNEMQIHSFPWPSDLLRQLGNTEVKIKITLSYFIEPSPGEVGWKDRYKYPSCGLRFEINKINQTREEFEAQVNKIAQDEERSGEPYASGTNNWSLGANNRNVGSIHSDYIIGNAIDLCDSKYVAVYPVGGWWKERQYLNRYNKKVKYSLIVSLSTITDLSVDLYTPIINQINVPVSVAVSNTSF